MSMVEFMQHFHKVHGTDYGGHAINHAFTTRDAVDAPQDFLRASVIKLTAAAAALTANQKSSSQISISATAAAEAELLKDGGMWRACKDMVYAVLLPISLACPWDTQCSLCFSWGASFSVADSQKYPRKERRER